ncbi:hypothetical protein [Streptomyces sp.]|uniref:hypothetical protein n=1 Tax=Streptomyces sp. TaxID=1931 RepID=UPI002F956B28
MADREQMRKDAATLEREADTRDGIASDGAADPGKWQRDAASMRAQARTLRRKAR